ncbi:MAG: glycosyltransferase [Caldilineaceae bacterium]
MQQIINRPAMTLCAMFAFHERLIPPPQLVRFLYGPAPAEAALDGLLGLNRYVEVAQRLRRRYGVRCPNMVGYLSNTQPLNLVFTSRYFQIGGDHAFDDSYKFVGPSVALPTETGATEEAFPWEALTGQPLIYISMGTMYNAEADFYHTCFAAFADRDYQVVLSIGQRISDDALRPAPANFIVRRHVPQLALLQRAALFITHGGMNSANEGILFHVPMIVLPQQADHYVVAQRVDELGAGIVLDRSQASAARLAALATQVLADPNYKQQCITIAQTFHEAGGYQRAADEIMAYKAHIGL